MGIRADFQLSILPQVPSRGEKIALRLGSASGWRTIVRTIHKTEYGTSLRHFISRTSRPGATLDAPWWPCYCFCDTEATISSLPPAVLESADVTAITQLILRERESRDLALWERMRTCFWPDSLVRVSWFRGNGADFVTGSIDMVRRGVAAKHRLAPILVSLNGNRAVATLSGIIDLPVKIKGVDGTLSTHSRFIYRAEKRGERWGISGFDAVYVRDQFTPCVPGQTVFLDPAELESFRPTYRLLSYYLKSQGYSIDSVLAGDDRPDLVEALNREIFSWAGLGIPR
jgi:SnoaL-like domain